jgi:hypothetical protein
MYERPAPKNKPQGLLLSIGIGFAFPHFKWADIHTNSIYGNKIPFDPDMGVYFSGKVGIVPLKWLGIGMNINFVRTFATNRSEFISIKDQNTSYKYDGAKSSGHLGGFIRLQYPTGRVVPFLDIAMGYSFSRYKWRVYDAATTDWEDIDWGWYNPDSTITYEAKYKQFNHFTFVLEPGVDIYIIPRFFAVGAHLWIPVAASSNIGADNIGLIAAATFTPMWREPKQLKPEYASSK